MTTPTLPRPFPSPMPQREQSAAVPGNVNEERKSPILRKFQTSSLTPSGTIHSTDHVGPATAAFEAAFSGFAHGTLIKTTQGDVAVEDLMPGMEVITSEHGVLPLLWVGSMTLVPHQENLDPRRTRLTRFMTDNSGMARPGGDLMAGPGARILTRAAELHDVVGTDQILMPAYKLVDGVNIIEITPPRPVSVYHLCLHRHATVSVGGLEAETFHPSPGFERNMRPDILALFLSFFPHIYVPSDFGPLTHPRAPGTDRI